MAMNVEFQNMKTTKRRIRNSVHESDWSLLYV